MYRLLCTLAALTFSAFSAAPRTARVTADVDAVTFAVAFRDGNADQFKSKQVRGTGMSFHGPITERLADGSTRTSLVITLGAVDRSGKLTPIDGWDDFVAADRARTTLVVALSGPNLPTPPSSAPTLYEFSGVYDGQVRTVPRATADRSSTSGQGSSDLGQAASPDSGPCAGERPRGDMQAGSFYCAPLLTGATATIRR